MGRLVDELWGERPPATAVKTVQVYVSRLRKLLGDEAVETRPTGYLLRLGPGVLDLERFEGLFAQGRRLEAEGAVWDAGEVLRKALGLWRGRPLVDFELEPFARNEIARLEGLRLACLELRLRVDLALGRHGELVGELRGLVGEHPLQESLRGLLMLALYRSDRQADALAVYQEGRAELVEGLGLDPSAALQQLEQQILRHDPSLDLPAPDDGEVRPLVVAVGVEARKVVTVLFCDVVADELADPETLRRVLAQSLELMRAAVSRHGGTVEKTAEGGLMAVFGVPAVHEDDALRALRAAVEIRDALPAHGLQARIGVQSGEVITSGEGPVTGVAVAIAKRLEATAAAGEVLIGELTLALAARAAVVEPAEPLQLRGNVQPVPMFRLVGVHETPNTDYRTSFVGRGPEVALIRAAWQRARGGRSCELITVVGGAGVGKSRLIAEALAPLDALILHGRCLSYGDGVTYWPVVEVLSQLDVEPPDAAAAPIGALLGETHTDTSAGEIAWAFRKTLEHAAGEQPLIVVFDDIHWGEETFLDLVEQLALLSSGAAILLLCMARPELLDRHSSWPVTLRLAPLADEEVEELIPPEIAGRLREKIARAAGGNPLFIEEMLAIAGEADEEVAVPPTLRALLAARLDQLDPAERSVLERGSIEGQLFHTAAVEALAGEPAPVERELAALVRKDLIWPDRAQLQVGDAYRFRHLLIRDAAYDTLPKASRARLHERFADWRGRQSADLAERDEIIGYHLEQAHRYRTELDQHDDETRQLGERAADRLASAGRRSTSRGDHAAAANLFERALALGLGDPRERTHVQLELAVALYETWRPAESDAMLAVIIDAATELGERGLAARARILRAQLGIYFELGVDLEAMLAAAEQPMATLTQLGDSLGLAWGERLLGQAYMRQGHASEALEAIRRALAHAEACGDRTLYQENLRLTGSWLCDAETPVDEVIRRCEELLESNRGDGVLEAVIGAGLSRSLAMAARVDEAREHLRRSGPVLEELNQTTVWLSRFDVAEAKELLGDRAGAERELAMIWQSFRAAGGDAIESRAMRAASRLALLYCDEGRFDDAADCLAYGLDLPEPTVLRHQANALHIAGRARLAAHRGEHVEALRLGRLAVQLAAGGGFAELTALVWLALAEVQRAAGETVAADAGVARALRFYEQKGNIAAAARLRVTA